MDDWLKSPSSPVPLVFGSPATTRAYYALEEAGRSNAVETLSHHQMESTLWYRALTLHLELQDGKWTPLPSRDDDDRRARNTQIDLLALGLCSSKAALDMVLAGYYSIAWAAIRHCIETSIHCQYLLHFPASYRLWYSPDDDPPSCKQMVEQIAKQHKHDEDPVIRQYVEMLQGCRKVWRLMSAGSHPTGHGLVQLQDPDHPEQRFWGSNYRHDLTMVSFDNGLYALNTMLDCYSMVREIPPDWRKACTQWKTDVESWRDSLRGDRRLAELSSEGIAEGRK